MEELRLKTWEVLVVAVAGALIGVAFMGAIVMFPRWGGWSCVNGGLLATSQVLVILAIWRAGFSRTRSPSRADPANGET